MSLSGSSEAVREKVMVGYRVVEVSLKSSHIDQYRDTMELAKANLRLLLLLVKSKTNYIVSKGIT